MHGGSDNGDFSRKVYINGIGPEGLAGGPETYNEIPAFSTIISNDTIKIGLPGYSVAYVVVEGKKSIKTTDIINKNNTITPLFQIYPNPASNTIYINAHGFKYNQILIYNILGQEVFQENINIESGEVFKLETSLSKGVYFIHLKNFNSVQTQKIIIF